VFVGILLTQLSACTKEEDKLELDKIPEKVMTTLNTKFPGVKINEWEKEEEDGFIVYDIEFEQDGHKLEADIKLDGSIHNWEKQVGIEDLPAIVKKAVAEKYPDAVPTEIMEIMVVKGGEDVLEGYEVVFESAAEKEFEILVAPDGEILEDSTAEDSTDKVSNDED
jgi:hypothetical protein